MGNALTSLVGMFLDATIVRIVRYTHSRALGDVNARDAQAALRKEIEELRARITLATPNNPCARGFKVYSQVDEDGILQNILSRIPGHSRTFIEVGCGDGVENNTHYLALQGYKGLWIDGDADKVASIRKALGRLDTRSLVVERKFVSVENIHQIIETFREHFGNVEIGVFSLDIDGNDLPVMVRSLDCTKPQVLCVEYNAKFPPPLSLTIRYDPEFRWQHDDYHGASLQAFCDSLVDYKLVSCNLTGANAFFVRRDLAEAFEDYSPSELYQPLRLNLTSLRAQHPGALKWLRDQLTT